MGSIKLINLYKSKYGEPKTKENKISKEIDDKVITGILKISSEYDPEIHRKITDTEFKNYKKNTHSMGVKDVFLI